MDLEMKASRAGEMHRSSVPGARRCLLGKRGQNGNNQSTQNPQTWRRTERFQTHLVGIENPGI